MVGEGTTSVSGMVWDWIIFLYGPGDEDSCKIIFAEMIVMNNMIKLQLTGRQELLTPWEIIYFSNLF